jgi:hypothetical protein
MPIDDLCSMVQFTREDWRSSITLCNRLTSHPSMSVHVRMSLHQQHLMAGGRPWPLCREDSFLGYQGDRRLGTTTSVKKSTIHAVGPMWRQDIGSSGRNSQWVKPYDFFVAPSLQTSPAPWWTGSSAALVGSLWVNGRVRRAQWIRGWLVWPENVHHSPCLRLPLNRHSWSRLRLARCPATLCMYLNLASVDNLRFHTCFSVHKNDSFCCSILKKKSSTISYMSYYSLRSYL